MKKDSGQEEKKEEKDNSKREAVLTDPVTMGWAGTYKDDDSGDRLVIASIGYEWSYVIYTSSGQIFEKESECGAFGDYLEGQYYTFYKNENGLLSVTSGAGKGWGNYRRISGTYTPDLEIEGTYENDTTTMIVYDQMAEASTKYVPTGSDIAAVRVEYNNGLVIDGRLYTQGDGGLSIIDSVSKEIYGIATFENGEVKEGEEEELTLKYRRFAHARRIAEELENARGLLQRDFAAQALRSVEQAAEYDKALEGIRDQLYDAEAILNDASREISSYMGSMEFDEEVFRTTESRLDQIHDLQRKYGNTTQLMLENLEKKKNRLEELENFDAYREKTEKELKEAQDRLERCCAELSKIRKTASRQLVEKIKKGLLDLNFLDVQFDMEFDRLPHFTASGYDEAQFLISTNPGQPVRPLMEVASGGELSRIMLAIKTVLADSDDIPTLIFDEIDTGISGRTAQKVSEKLSYIAKSHQVICITHLPQIAAMADTHFEIHKAASEGSTATSIRRLNREQTVEELARLLGGAKITDTVIQNAREMKELADKTK